MLAPIIGDAVHNLRSALDILACDLAKLNGQSDDGVYFPFAKSESELDRQIAGRRFDRAGPAAVAELKALRPYKGGNTLLRGVHDLDIQDKHQFIIPVDGSVRTLWNSGQGLEVYGVLWFGNGGPFAGEQVVHTLGLLAGEVERTIKVFETLHGR